jgi:hypothetical protein
LILLISILGNVGIGIDLINSVYCDSDDDVIISDSTNSNNDKDDKSYQFSISKQFVKEGFESVVKVLSDSLPEIISGIGSVKLGTAVVKAVKGLTPVQRAALGVVTAGAGGLALGLGSTVVKNVRKNNEYGGGDDLIVRIPRETFKEMVKGDTGKRRICAKNS